MQTINLNQFSLNSLTSKTKYVFVFVLIVLVYLSIKDYKDFMPQGIHHWAQGDRLSIALQYYEHLNFMEPRTYYLEISEGKTGVEFPIVQYVTAIIAKVLQHKNWIPFIYRILTLSIYILGLYFLFLGFNIQKNIPIFNALLVLFYGLSPVLIFYSFNVLPDASSLGLIFISFYYFQKFRHQYGYFYIFLTLLFTCFATLIKTTSGLFYSIYIAWYFWYMISNQLFDYKKILKFIIILLLLVSINGFVIWYFSIRANQLYQSGVFLSSSRHITDISQWSDVFYGILKWHKEYFFQYQYVLIIPFLILSFFRQKNAELIYKLLILIALVIFLYLFGKQLIDHDYYAICTIIPYLIFISFTGFQNIGQSCISLMIFLGITYYTYNNTKLQQYNRLQEKYTLNKETLVSDRNWMLNGNKILDSLNVAVSEKILICYEWEPNTSLVYFGRTGMTFNPQQLKSDSNLLFKYQKLYHSKYLIIRENNNKGFINEIPSIYSKLMLFYKNKDFNIYKINIK